MISHSFASLTVEQITINYLCRDMCWGQNCVNLEKKYTANKFAVLDSKMCLSKSKKSFGEVNNSNRIA